MRSTSECVLILSGDKVRGLVRLFLLFQVMFIIACSSHPKGPPGKDIIKSDRFVEILTDIHFAEGAYQTVSHTIDYLNNPDRDTLAFYQAIFEKHGTDRETFERSMEYYSYNPHQFEAIYDEVVDRLNRMITEEEMRIDNLEEP